MLEGQRDAQRTIRRVGHIYVRYDGSAELIRLGNLINVREFADAGQLNRYSRIRAVTIEANLENGLSLGAGLEHLENLVAEHFPEHVVISYKGQSLEYKQAGGSVMFILLVGIMITLLVLAAQLGDYVHQIVIMFTVPLAIGGGLLGLYFTGNSLNVYSQIGL